MSQTRLLGADFLRAAACLLVLFHHLVFRINIDQAPEVLQPLMRFLVNGSFGVSIFFVLSGYLLARPFWQALDRGEPMPSLATYALRRAARILPGFWLALTVSFVLGLILLDPVLTGERITRFVAGFLLVSDWHWLTLFPVDNNGPLWSIGFEVTSYLLLPMCLSLLFVTGVRGWAARLAWVGVIGATLAVHAMVVAWAPIDEFERGWNFGLIGGAKAWMPRFNPIGFFAIFALGALASGIQIKLAHLRHWSFDLVGLAAILAAILLIVSNIGGLNEGFGWLGIPYGYPWMPLAIGLALVALPSSVLAGRLLDNAVARFVAEISFGIYIWHFLIMSLMTRLLPPSFDTGGPNGWTIWIWSSLGTIVASVVVATISLYLLERPMVQWARRLEPRLARPHRLSVEDGNRKVQ